MTGVVVVADSLDEALDAAARHPEAVRDLAGWLAEGKLKYHETIADGIHAAPGAFIGLLGGANVGKQLVKLI